MIYNIQGDFVLLTDASAKVVVKHTYDAITNTWSNPAVTNNAEVASKKPYRYANYRYDDATSMYYLIARYYDPKVGRFINADPSKITPEYGYANNNPLLFVDPNGKNPILVG